MAQNLHVLALDIDGVLTDGSTSLNAAGDEAKRISFHDLDAVTLARRNGMSIVMVTAEDTASVELLAQRFGVENVVRGAKDKAKALQTLSVQMGIPLSQFCYVGDSDRDAPALASVGLGLAPSNATPLAKAAAHKVLSHSGGSGAVAEAVRLLLQLQRDAELSDLALPEMRRIAEESLAIHELFLQESLPTLVRVSQQLLAAIRSGRKILLFGNGGSAADAQHVAGELVGRFLRESDPWSAIALTTDSSILTCVGNDWEFTDVFARQVRALARAGDVVVGISTSGSSPNVLRGLEAGRLAGAVTIGFTGSGGGTMACAADICFQAPSAVTPRIQELHLLAWHIVCEIVEREMLRTVEAS